MFEIDKTTGYMKLTRGDTARFHMGTVTNRATTPPTTYTILSTDTLEFSVKKSVRDTTALIHKTITGNQSFHILPTDTKQLAFGKYVYDVQLTTVSGDVYTLTDEVPPTFELLKEVT